MVFFKAWPLVVRSAACPAAPARLLGAPCDSRVAILLHLRDKDERRPCLASS
jgi:hypothetical protein